MLKAERARTYRQVARAQAAHATEKRIIEAATQLLAEAYYDDVTLAAVARLAAVSTKTVIRRFGSKDALAARVLAGAAGHHGALRDSVPAGDVDAALAMILETYELFGDTALRNLALEGRIPMVTAFARKGRSLHAAWVARVFGPPVSRAPARRAQDLALLVVATDVYTWKVLRRDRKLTAVETGRAMRRLIDSVIRKGA
ncbi:MAG: TetR family transcriptional regulator [Kofleriaceae bacterium]|nr:TetR family transcriptional regulator [Kofleriaceae bacterium]